MDRLVHAKGIFDSKKCVMDDTGLLIQDGVIKGRGDFEEMKVRWPDVPVLDYREEYILPGLINTHVHLEFKPGGNTYQTYRNESDQEHIRGAVEAAKCLLHSGVTAVRDAGSSMELVKWLKKTEKGRREAAHLPRLFLSGPTVTARGGHLGFLGGEAQTRGELEAEAVKRRENECSCIKMIVSGGQLTPGSVPERDSYGKQEICILTRAAKKEKMKTAAHCLTMDSLVHAMEGGADSIEHCACFKRNEKNGLLERVYEPERMKAFEGDPRFFMPGLSNNYHLLDHVRNGIQKADARERFLLDQEQKAFEIVNRLTGLGMRPTVGTDGGCGLTYFDETWLELELLVKGCGMDCGAAIKAATCHGAEALGREADLGSLKEGYAADFITVSADPLKDIKALAAVNHVILGGNIVK